MRVKLFIVLAVFFSIELHAQEIEDEVYFDSQDTIYLPHYGQNEILDRILDITMKRQDAIRGSTIGTLNDNIPFYIPVKIWVYHNDDGSKAALSEDEALLLFNEVNRCYANSNTGIQFYLKCGIEHVHSTKFNTIDNDNEFDQMIDTYRESYAHNWHLIYNTTTGWAGKGVFPWKKNNFSFAVRFGGSLSDALMKTTVHEIGHTLGLLHTHENTRGMGNYNGDAAKCFQESVSRTRTQGIGCVFTIGKKKCEINGDALCDTEAAPNTKNKIQIIVDSNCNYTDGGTDNWGDAWDPPVENYMSYLSVSTCRSKFTSGQIAVMHMSIVHYMRIGGGSPWYNLHSISLSGTVNSGENESFIVPQRIEAPPEMNTYTINSGATVNLFAGESIKLKSGFHAKAGSVFIAKTGNLTACSTILPGIGQRGDSYSMPIGSLSQEDIDECISIITKALNREYYSTDLSEKRSEVEEVENDESNDFLFSIYPNPNNGTFQIDANFPLTDIINFKIINLLGTPIYETQNFTSNTMQLGTSASGYCFVIMVLKDGSVLTQKMVIQQ